MELFNEAYTLYTNSFIALEPVHPGVLFMTTFALPPTQSIAKLKITVLMYFTGHNMQYIMIHSAIPVDANVIV